MTLPRPIAKPPVPWAFPQPHEHSLSNGATLLIYPVPGQHIASTRVVVPAPLVAEPREREGVATLVSRTMDEGTASRSGEEMAQALERNGIGLAASAGEGGIVMEIESTVARLETGLELLTEALAEPVFDEAEVSRHQRQRLAEIEQSRARPATCAALEWVAARYSPQDRASRPSGGSAETVAAITRSDCVDFHRDRVGPAGSTVIVAGDVDVDAVVSSMERTYGAWAPESRSAATALTPLEVAADLRRVVFVDRPGAVQTELYLGTTGPSRRVEGPWAPYPVAAYLIGGSPNARIDALLREDKGFTYGIRSSIRPRVRGGEFVIAGSVRADATAQALELLTGVLGAAAADGFTADEIKAGVDYLGKTAPARYSTADVLAGEAATLALDGLRTDFVTSYLDQLREVEPDSLLAAWRRIHAQDWTVVLVGDASAHADAVRGLDLGEVTVVS